MYVSMYDHSYIRQIAHSRDSFNLAIYTHVCMYVYVYTHFSNSMTEKIS